ncbi:MAG TPA: hypothetical protein VK891_13780 [Euzebyales bacterium]|nr:hypothetical protein [Euzebyales bacterium]
MQPAAMLMPVAPQVDGGEGRASALTEAAHALADEVREVLIDCGFTTGEIDRWAASYTRLAGFSDADAFLDGISTYERSWLTTE